MIRTCISSKGDKVVSLTKVEMRIQEEGEGT
jgi:hypothetical protein